MTWRINQPFTNRLMFTSVALMSDRHLSIVRSGEGDAWYPETRLQTLKALELLRSYGWGVPTRNRTAETSRKRSGVGSVTRASPRTMRDR